MQLSELYLNRQLYKEGQTSETDNTEYVSANQTNYPSGYIAYGGNAAIDVNTNTPDISGNKIRTGAVESTFYTYTSGVFSTNGMQINLDNGVIRSPQFGIDSAGNAYFKGDISGSSGTFSGNITVGTGNNVFKAFAGTGIWVGNAVFGSAQFSVDMTGYLYATNAYITGTISSSSIIGGTIAIGSGNNIFKADSNGIYLGNATFGSAPFRVDMTGAVNASNLTIANGGTSTTTGNLRWGNASKIWEDSSSYLGVNSVGERIYFYTGDTHLYSLFQRGQQAAFYTGVSSQGPLNVVGSDSRLEGTNYLYSSNNHQFIWGGNGSETHIGAQNYIYFKIGNYPGSEEMRLSAVGLTLQGYLYQPNSSIIVHGGGAGITSTLPAVSGTLKNAIVPTSKGFKALACMESPEVWFMDFCTGTRTEDIDPMFLEVTVPTYHFIMCEGGEYQVWGKRKGHEDKRFEAKTGKEFVANERFLSMNKPSYQFN